MAAVAICAAGLIGLNSMLMPATLSAPYSITARAEKNPLVIINGILIDGKTCEGAVTIPDGVTSIGKNAFFSCTRTAVRACNRADRSTDRGAGHTDAKITDFIKT